jgi:hypothetical protein
MKVDVAVKNLREVKEVFDKVGVTFWLDTGTLLGAVRDGQIIEWDTDVDMGTWYDDLAKLLFTFPELRKRGFNITLNRKWADMTVRRFDCNVNVCLYHKRGGYVWRVSRMPKKGLILNVIIKILQRCVNISNLRVYTKQKGTFAEEIKNFSSLLPSVLKRLPTDTAWLALHRLGCLIPMVIPKQYFENLSTIQFYGMEFNAPFDVEKYLRYRYGSNWRMPKEKYEYYKEDGARAPNENWLCLVT